MVFGRRLGMVAIPWVTRREGRALRPLSSG